MCCTFFYLVSRGHILPHTAIQCEKNKQTMGQHPVLAHIQLLGHTEKWDEHYFMEAPSMQQLLSSNFPLLTCEGALQESPPLISPIRAAAVGLLELIRTGPLISMEWRWGGGASMGLWDMVREVKECRFLLFFFSPARWAPLLWGPEEAPSPDSPLESDGLSNSISCRAAELNCEIGREAGGNEERVVRWK